MAQQEYRLLTYQDGAHAKAGILVNNRIYDCVALLEGNTEIDASSVRGILANWDTAHEQLKQAAGAVDPNDGMPLEDVQLCAPILYPGAIFCAGANYWDHFDEMADYMVSQGNPRPDRVKSADPFFFLKTTEHSIVGPNAKVAIPAKTKMLDWEAELALVVGREASNISTDNVLDIIAGCTILNDLSARDYVIRHDSAFKFDWTPHKCFDGSAPMGPWITPLEFVGDPQNLSIKTWVGDELKQDSNTKLMIHSIAEQIVYLTHHITLRPGDVIATGTPAGVGYPQETFLKPGDQVRIEIENCDALVTHIV
jgi:2-keto-4-pentenoate hydratase/2-oxohepta-3-ene-1,7-dioic acid hydratase in catechol pathway